jgi:ABC-type antimicrobial peptide transport system permease subunit
VPARSLALIVRARTTPRAQADPVRLAFRKVDPGLATWDVRTMDELRAYTTWEQRFFGHLMGGFAGQALLLACLGVYGVLAHAVNLRMREIGVRLALGARPLDVLGLVLRRGMALGVAGVALGVALAFALAGVLESLLYGVEPFDPWPLAILSGLLLLVVAAASLLPARRAAAVDPLVSLRAE